MAKMAENNNATGTFTNQANVRHLFALSTHTKVSFAESQNKINLNLMTQKRTIELIEFVLRMRSRWVLRDERSISALCHFGCSGELASRHHWSNDTVFDSCDMHSCCSQRINGWQVDVDRESHRNSAKQRWTITKPANAANNKAIRHKWSLLIGNVFGIDITRQSRKRTDTRTHTPRFKAFKQIHANTKLLYDWRE